MDVSTFQNKTNLNWANVGLGLAFILFNAVISAILRLGVGGALVTSAFRCILQLSVIGLILQGVFETDDPWVVGAIAFVLNFLGTFEAVVNKSKKRYDRMFISVLMSMLGSTIPVSIIGARYAMVVDPFWTSSQYIPVVGMLCGSTVSGIVVAISYLLKELHDNREKVETYLAFGASRFEACLPIARETLRLALTPVINQMSVIGMISTPGMMTGAILGGSSVGQAAKLQMIIMFMISASTALAAIVTTIATLSVVVDNEHRVRPDRVNVKEHVIWRGWNRVFVQIVSWVRVLVSMGTWWRKNDQSADDHGEHIELIRSERN